MAADKARDPSQPGDPSGRAARQISGPAVTDVRRSYVEEQYPTFVRNNRLRTEDIKRLREEASTFAHEPLFSILVPVLEAGGGWHQRALEWTLDSAVAQLYPGWELLVCPGESAPGCPEDLVSGYQRLDGRVKIAARQRGTGGEAGLVGAALAAAEGEFVWVLQEGDELAPEALLEVTRLLQEWPETDLVYTDEDSIDEEGNRTEPRFKPGWSPDLLLSTNYIGRSGVYRRKLVDELGGIRESLDSAYDHDLLLRLTERTDGIRHVPKVLYHKRKSADASGSSANGPEGRRSEGTRAALAEALERRGLGGTVEDGLLTGTFRVRPEIRGNPLVSIIMPTKDHAHLLKACIESIEGLTTYPRYEILIVDNGSTEPATLEYLAQTPHQVIPFPEQYNHPKINNLGVSRARGDYVVLLNDDTEVMDGGWLEAMLEPAQRPEVGAVGAKLLYPDGRVQHAGVVTTASVWTRGVATHAYQFFGSEDPGHLGTLSTTTNYSAVTAACVLLPRAVYEEIGGIDEELRVSFDDVDLCLRLRERGYLVVCTPHARLLHHESITLGRGVDLASEITMRKRWEGKLDEDPYYNPHFSRGGGDFNLRADLLRPKVLRDGGEMGNPSGVPLLTNAQLQQESPAEIESYLETQRKVVRDSSRTTIVPRMGAGTAKAAVLESLDHEDPSAPQEEKQIYATAQPRPQEGPAAEQLIWMFGSPRTGSTWLSKMMAELENQERWNEPYIGLLFGSFLYERLDGNTKLLDNPSFILSNQHRGTWLRSIKNFVLEGARARYENLRDDQYLVVKEPNGSLGASLLMEAMPECRMIFLIRDPRDVIASRLDAVRKGSWTAQNRDFDALEKVEAFTRHLAEDYLKVVSQVQRAYDAHRGEKVFVRYEDLRADTLGTLESMYGALGIEVDGARLKAAVAKHSWEQIPDSDKGSGKFYRKARPGGWDEDLSPEQIKIIEEITEPVLSKYYRPGAADQTFSG